jgi:hypothetical protein
MSKQGNSGAGNKSQNEPTHEDLAQRLDGAHKRGIEAYGGYPSKQPIVRLQAGTSEVKLKDIPWAITDALYPPSDVLAIEDGDTLRALMYARSSTKRRHSDLLCAAIKRRDLRALHTDRTPYENPPISGNLAGVNATVTLADIQAYLKGFEIVVSLDDQRADDQRAPANKSGPKPKVEALQLLATEAAERHYDSFTDTRYWTAPKVVIHRDFVIKVFGEAKYVDPRAVKDPKKYLEQFGVHKRAMLDAVRKVRMRRLNSAEISGD